MSMFCYQCQEAAGGKACKIRGVCGKDAPTSNLQDLLIYALRGLSEIAHSAGISDADAQAAGRLTAEGLFVTITNANFDNASIEQKIKDVLSARDALKAKYNFDSAKDAVLFSVSGFENMLEKAEQTGILSVEDEDVRSLQQLILYGLKGMAAYIEHACNLGEEDLDIYRFMFKALSLTLEPGSDTDALLALVIQTGEYGVKAMALLDKANTSKYGSPEITKVNLGVRNNPAILISGHDLRDLEQLLEQTRGTGVDVYTHSEMLPAHYYPFFKKYDNLAGNYGNAWWKQVDEFKSFNGAMLFTTNCLVPPRSENLKNRIYTTGSSGFPGCKHITADADGNKDFSEVIALAKTLPAPDAIEEGEIVGGFAHNQIALLADKVVDAVKSGAIKRFFVMGGCDGRMRSREYYTEFAKNLPEGTVILTAGCAKFRYNKLNLGDIGGIPRVLDAGQCNDSYSLAVTALTLKDAFGLSDINDLPITYNIAWYEQKAVIVLLALLSLGVKNIHLGPTLPAFLSPAVTQILVEKFGIGGITTPGKDIAQFMA